MKLKQHAGLAVWSVAATLLIFAAAFMLFRFQRHYAAVNEQLQEQQTRFQALNNRDPYPSSSNIKLARKNLDNLRGYFRDVSASLREGQIEPRDMERADFPPLVERTLNSLWTAAAQSKVSFPENFAFGFQRYIAGELPATNYIPRLMVELKEVEELCRLLFDARISRLTDITRTEFDVADVQEATESSDSGRGRTRGRKRARSKEKKATKTITAGVDAAGDGIYTVEKYKLSFTARENALWTLLNNMANSPMFVVVTSIRVQGVVEPIELISYAALQEDKIRTMAADGRLTAQQQVRIQRICEQGEYDLPPREERVVAGREAVNVELECAIYRFNELSEEGLGQ